MGLYIVISDFRETHSKGDKTQKHSNSKPNTLYRSEQAQGGGGVCQTNHYFLPCLTLGVVNVIPGGTQECALWSY